MVAHRGALKDAAKQPQKGLKTARDRWDAAPVPGATPAVVAQASQDPEGAREAQFTAVNCVFVPALHQVRDF